MTTFAVVVARRTARVSSATTITRSRRYRSPSTAVNGEAAADGRNRTSPTSPTAAAPPSRYANTASAMPYDQCATIEAAHAPSIRRILGFRKTWPKERAESPRRARSALTRQASHEPVVFFESKVEDCCAHCRLVGQISGGDKCERSRGNGRRAD